MFSELYKLNKSRLLDVLQKVLGSLSLSSVSFASLNDQDIYSILSEIYHKNSSHSSLSSSKLNNKWKACEQQLLSLLNRDQQKHISWLDYGGGEGDFAYMMKNKCNLTNVYNVEIQDWYQHKHTQKFSDVQYLFVDEKKVQISLDNNSIDVVSCLQVLHHVYNVVDVLKEIKRVLKPNGYLFLREHECDTYEDELTLDIEHLLYEIVIKQNKAALSSYFAMYFNKQWLKNKLFEAGFKYVNESATYGSSKCYYAVFQLKK